MESHPPQFKTYISCHRCHIFMYQNHILGSLHREMKNIYQFANRFVRMVGRRCGGGHCIQIRMRMRECVYIYPLSIKWKWYEITPFAVAAPTRNRLSSSSAAKKKINQKCLTHWINFGACSICSATHKSLSGQKWKQLPLKQRAAVRIICFSSVRYFVWLYVCCVCEPHRHPWKISRRRKCEPLVSAWHTIFTVDSICDKC